MSKVRRMDEHDEEELEGDRDTDCDDNMIEDIPLT